MASPYAALTDGTTTITFADGSGGSSWYRISNTWGPKIASLRQSQLGGYGPYENVDEDMALTIAGSTAPHLYSNLDALNRLIDQAQRWYRGENKTAVLFKYSPTGATVSTSASPLQAAVLGGALELPENFHDAGNNLKLMDARLRFTRRGLWLHRSASVSASAISESQTALSLGSAASYPSPTEVEWYPSFTTTTQPFGFLLYENSSSVTLLNAETGSGGAFTAVADAGSVATGGSVLRYTPATTTEVMSGGIVWGANLGKTFFILANIRQNSGTTNFSIRVSNAGYSYTEYISVAACAGSGSCRWYPVGMLTGAGGSTINLHITASSAAGSIDIDSIITIDVSYPYVFYQYKSSGVAVFGGSASVDHRALTDPTPLSGMSGFAITPLSDAYISTSASILYARELVNGDTSSGIFIATNRWKRASGSIAESTTFAITRYTGYPTPV